MTPEEAEDLFAKHATIVRHVISTLEEIKAQACPLQATLCAGITTSFSRADIQALQGFQDLLKDNLLARQGLTELKRTDKRPGVKDPSGCIPAYQLGCYLMWDLTEHGALVLPRLRREQKYRMIYNLDTLEIDIDATVEALEAYLNHPFISVELVEAVLKRRHSRLDSVRTKYMIEKIARNPIDLFRAGKFSSYLVSNE